MDERLNYLGAVIFWLYIVAALFFMGVVIYTIVTLPGSSSTSKQQLSQDVAIFSILAFISFAVLSFNMLNVLIQSFKAWYGHNITLTELRVEDIWSWSIESTLFRDFAEALVSTTPRQYWMQAALLATMSVGLFVGSEGHRRNMPRLWAFFCLGQILPISFTQNLFYVALLRQPDTKAELLVLRRPITIMLFTYTACVITAYVGGEWLLPIILTARLSLFAPLILCERQPNDNMDRSRLISGEEMQQMLRKNASYVVILAIYLFARQGLAVKDVLTALAEHPAVSSLGCDLIISALSFGVWTLRSTNRAASSTIYEDKAK